MQILHCVEDKENDITCICKYTFVACHLILNNNQNEIFQISLKKLYVVNNVIDEKVFLFLLKQQHNRVASKHTVTVTLLDNEYRIVELSAKDSIRLHENHYEVIEN
jgi:hypothetical protein